MVRPTAAPAALAPTRPVARRGSARPARTLVLGLAARLLGYDALVARQNAWEAVCANRERRRQWEEAF